MQLLLHFLALLYKLCLNYNSDHQCGETNTGRMCCQEKGMTRLLTKEPVQKKITSQKMVGQQYAKGH